MLVIFLSVILEGERIPVLRFPYLNTPFRVLLSQIRAISNPTPAIV